ncbi:MAG TPA: nuclear transport factor 2 family protein [Pyrinomonadaceae bacterium]|nr:nuclear transport factor 2 family protein [Pyrinomonadaceae bacterium]
MSEYDNLNVVKEIYSAQRGRNIPALLEFLTDDVRWFSIGPPESIPTAGTRYGRNQVEQYFTSLHGMEELENCEPQEFIVQGDKVVAIGDLQRYVPSTGSLVKSPWIHVFTLHKGKIAEFRSFYDTAAAIAALEGGRARLTRSVPEAVRRSFL